MSGKVSGQVWECDLPRPEKYVLLALADHADHDGEGVKPGIELVAWKTQYDIRQVQRLVRSLEAMGALVPVEFERGGRGKVTLYRIDLSAVPRLPARPKRVTSRSQTGTVKGDISAQKRVTSMSPFEDQDVTLYEAERVTSQTIKGDIFSRAHTSIPGNVIETSKQQQPLPQLSSHENALSDVLPKIAKRWSAIDGELTEGWLRGELQKIEGATGPMSREQLIEGLRLAQLQIERKSANGGITSSVRGFAHRVVSDCLEEQRRGS